MSASDDAASPWAIRLAAIEFGIRERGKSHAAGSTTLTPEELNQTLDALDERGIDHGWKRAYPAEVCVPPRREPKSFDAEEHWSELQGERYEAYIDADGPVICADDPGTGKTTNLARGAAARNRSHVVLFDKHEKARRFIQKDVTPDSYTHLLGPEQPRYECCLDALIDAPEGEIARCPEHGTENEWPRLCPIYDDPPDSPRRQRFEVLAALLGRSKAHEDFCGECPWSVQYEGLGEQERFVGVHEHQQLFANLAYDVIIDETPRPLAEKQKWSVGDLHQASTLLETLDAEFAEPLATFIREKLIGAVLEGSLTALEPPTLNSENPAEILTALKVRYNERLRARLERDDWDGTPPCFDAILAALAALGAAPDACRKAIAGPTTLATCPWCGAPTAEHEGIMQCEECGWDEAAFPILPPWQRETARAIAYVDQDDDRNTDENRLYFESYPHPDELPETPLILDATATPTKVAGLYGVPVDDVAVYGDEPIEMNAEVTQVTTGQYHAGTIKNTESLRTRIQAVIDNICDAYDRPLFLVKRSLLSEFRFPEHALARYYGGTRGLDIEECDTVVCIGAPHPNIEGVNRQAKLLAMDHPDLRVGGREYSTRRNAPNPPIYRKLYYEDEHGRGRAVPTKHYTGLVGDLFRESREKELVQCAHRVRPIPADETKYIYLLTNVPTALPIDELVSLDELTNKSLGSVLPIPEETVPHLLEPLHAILDGDDPAGVHDELLLERTDEYVIGTKKRFHKLAERSGADVEYETVTRWVNALEDLGLLTRGEYQYREGDRYIAERSTFTRALLVLSSNTGVKVATLNRFKEKVEQADGSLDWLNWAIEAFGLSEGS